MTKSGEPRVRISQETLDEVARVAREWPDGVHTCAELQRAEPGRRPCTCGRCPVTWRCEYCGWIWPLKGSPPASAECDACGGEMIRDNTSGEKR